ncbi:MAG: hypothetical protein R3321_13705 [Nitrososphaeraceae archaeon]|nr:hypothetical protein [Nitrososphaeraceae archaeon]
MENKTMNKIKNFYIRIDWSDECTGDCETTFNGEFENLDKAWDYILREYYNTNIEDHGTFLNPNTFTFDLYWSETQQLLVFYNELQDPDFQYEDDELVTYCKTYTISIEEEN